MDPSVVIWLVLLVVFLAVEAASVAIVSLWFAAGALVALIAGLLGAGVGLQALLFLTVSAGLLIALRPLVRRFIHPKLTATNVDSVIGSTGLVTIAVDNISAVGQVKLGAMEWTARSSSGAPIPQGTLVRVDRIEGVKVFVSPMEVPAQV